MYVICKVNKRGQTVMLRNYNTATKGCKCGGDGFTSAPRLALKYNLEDATLVLGKMPSELNCFIFQV